MTGTPPRLHGATIHWASPERQPEDDPPDLSLPTAPIATPAIQRGITRTTAATHEIIRADAHRSPMYSGQIQAAVRAIARQSRTRSCASASATGTRSS